MGRNKRIYVIIIALVLGFFILQLGRAIFREEEYRARKYISKTVRQIFPMAAQEVDRGYGLRAHGSDQVTGEGKTVSPVVILIHGLDEPGRIWMNLIPALKEKGYQILLMTYPNDQPVADSARFFYRSLEAWVLDGDPIIYSGQAVSLVAHSMGGLVSRQMLTDPEIGYERQVITGKAPRVGNLLMVGTPNHGSELARFRFFTEVRDQFQQMLSNDGHWLKGLLDGAGEAGIDLLPGSPFLTELNGRPNPKGLEMEVIAGVIRPWDTKDVHFFINNLKKSIPDTHTGDVITLETALISVGNTLGDGLVPVDSAKLAGAGLHLVNGTHLTMIRNLSEESPRIPPAVPLILDLLPPVPEIRY